MEHAQATDHPADTTVATKQLTTTTTMETITAATITTNATKDIATPAKTGIATERSTPRLSLALWFLVALDTMRP